MSLEQALSAAAQAKGGRPLTDAERDVIYISLGLKEDPAVPEDKAAISFTQQGEFDGVIRNKGESAVVPTAKAKSLVERGFAKYQRVAEKPLY